MTPNSKPRRAVSDAAKVCFPWQVLSNVTAAPVLLTEANGIFLDSLDEPLLWDYAQRSLLLGRPDELYDIQNFTHPSTLQKLAPNPLDPALLAGDQIATYQLVSCAQRHTKCPYNALMMIICSLSTNRWRTAQTLYCWSYA